ncbi:MAG: hypothetical protein WCT20_02250, partial [Candidatus Babeliales bacterium]
MIKNIKKSIVSLLFVSCCFSCSFAAMLIGSNDNLANSQNQVLSSRISHYRTQITLWLKQLSSSNDNLAYSKNQVLSAEIARCWAQISISLKKLPDDTKISLSTEAEGAWTAGELKHFDPLVGNSLCEIPTLVIARLYDEYRKHPIDKDVLEKFPKTLFLFNKEMLEKSPEMLFLFVAFLLTKYKKSKQDASKICGYSEWIDLKKDDVRVIPNSFLNHAQRLIAAMSIAYLEKHCETG